MKIAAGGGKAPKIRSRLSSVCAESSVLGKDEEAAVHESSADTLPTFTEPPPDQTPLSERTVALTRIVHDVNVGPQFRAGQVVAVLDRII